MRIHIKEILDYDKANNLAIVGNGAGTYKKST